MARRAHAVVDSPVGPLTLLAADGALAGLYLHEKRHPPPADAFGEHEPALPLFAGVDRQLAAYFDGALTEFDVPLYLDGTPFQRTVWSALLEIPYGETVSYRELAERLRPAGHPHPGQRPPAARAIGQANARNPISIIVPCHRVVGSSGGLVGYGGGLDRKRQLLALERRHGTLFGSRTDTFGS